MVRFKFHFEANLCVNKQRLDGNNWITYIPNHKVRRSCIIKGISSKSGLDEIKKNIKVNNSNIEIIYRLKDSNFGIDLEDT